MAWLRLEARGTWLADWRGAWGRGAVAGLDVGRAACRIVLGLGKLDLGGRLSVLMGSFEEFFQIRAAPAAAGARAKALAHLAGAPWSFDLQKVEHFPLRDVKAKAEFVVEVHSD